MELIEVVKIIHSVNTTYMYKNPVLQQTVYIIIKKKFINSCVTTWGKCNIRHFNKVIQYTQAFMILPDVFQSPLHRHLCVAPIKRVLWESFAVVYTWSSWSNIVQALPLGETGTHQGGVRELFIMLWNNPCQCSCCEIFKFIFQKVLNAILAA